MAEIIRHSRKISEEKGRAQQASEHLQNIKRILHENKLDDSITKDSIKEIEKSGHPGHVSYPIIMLLLGATVDFIDFFEPSGVGALISFPIQAVWFVASWIWYTGKIKGVFWKKILLKRGFWIIFCIVVAELTPIVDMFIPGNVLMISWAHNRHKKIVQIGEEILEIIHLYYKPKKR